MTTQGGRACVTMGLPPLLATQNCSVMSTRLNPQRHVQSPASGIHVPRKENSAPFRPPRRSGLAPRIRSRPRQSRMGPPVPVPSLATQYQVCETVRHMSFASSVSVRQVSSKLALSDEHHAQRTFYRGKSEVLIPQCQHRWLSHASPRWPTWGNYLHPSSSLHRCSRYQPTV